MKTMCPPGYHHNGPVATHALGHMMYIYIYMYMYRNHKEIKQEIKPSYNLLTWFYFFMIPV